MKVYALTGGIASGKSTVSAYLKELGVDIIDCDALVDSAYAPGQPIFEAIVSGFGKDVLDDSGNVNRRKLGSVIFSDQKQREKLNQITHPIVEKMIQSRIKEFEKAGNRFVVVDIPLLYEIGAEDQYDGVLVVCINMEMQVERLMQRNAWSYDEAMNRIGSQFPMSHKESLATWCIYNESHVDDLKEAVRNWFNLIKELNV